MIGPRTIPAHSEGAAYHRPLEVRDLYGGVDGT
jgi:hypothetical protein